jgi:L-ribulokinase
VASSAQAPALGATMFGAVAAGVHASIVDAAHAMAAPPQTTYSPDAAHVATYDALYREYLRLHDLFGRGGDDVMRTLKGLQRSAPIAVS